jgi:hypothetical protein
LLAPLALVDVPPLLDYPNHLARAMVLAAGTSDPVLSRMYATRWTIVPNLGTDLVLPPLLQFLPVHLAGRIVIGITILLPVVGTIAYSRSLFGRYTPWPLASGLVAYNATLLLGFLNFAAAIGMALLVAAGWIGWRERHPVVVAVLAAFGTVALFFCHLMGPLFFFVLIAGYELEQLIPGGRRPIVMVGAGRPSMSFLGRICKDVDDGAKPRHDGGAAGASFLSRAGIRRDPSSVLRRVAALIPAAAPPFVLYLLSPLAPLADETAFSSIADKAVQLVFPFANYVLWLDVMTACAVAAYLLACLATRRCRSTPAGGLAVALTALLFLAVPFAFKGTYFFDTRFVIMLGFLLFGALLPCGLPRLAAVAFTMLFAVRMAVVLVVWWQYRGDLAALRTVIANVRPDDRVFIAAVSPDEAPFYWQNGPLSRRLSVGLRLDSHLPALLLIERRAYWPFMFDNPSQQPVETLPPYRELAERAGSIADHRELAEPRRIDLCGYTHVLLLEASGEPDLARFAQDRLALLGRTDYAALFRVRPSACAS